VASVCSGNSLQRQQPAAAAAFGSSIGTISSSGDGDSSSRRPGPGPEHPPPAPHSNLQHPPAPRRPAPRPHQAKFINALKAVQGQHLGSTLKLLDPANAVPLWPVTITAVTKE
jgi:hypothetical protein